MRLAPHVAVRTCFNPRPAFSCGAARSTSQMPLGAEQYYEFQSAPRILVRSGVLTGYPLGSSHKFQSAPRILVRSGVLLYCAAQSSRAVSIRAPHSRAERHQHASQCRFGKGVSIRAPHSRAERRLASFENGTHRIVSIRAPHSRAERLRVWKLYGLVIKCFNPRPAFSCGAASSSSSSLRARTCFNPRPAFSCGAALS